MLICNPFAAPKLERNRPNAQHSSGHGPEVILKLFVYRLRFFCMHGCAWNILDFIVSALQIFEETAALVFAVTQCQSTHINNRSPGQGKPPIAFFVCCRQHFCLPCASLSFLCLRSFGLLV